MIVEDSGSEKRNTLLTLINHEPDIDKFYLYANVPYEGKYYYLTKDKVQA